MKLNNKSYDIIKWIVQGLMPAIITLVGTIGVATGWLHTELTMTILGAITAFLGTSLGISSGNYFKDHKVVKERKDLLSQEELEHFFEGK